MPKLWSNSNSFLCERKATIYLNAKKDVKLHKQFSNFSSRVFWFSLQNQRHTKSEKSNDMESLFAGKTNHHVSSHEKFLPALLEMWVPFSDTKRKKPDRTQLSHWTVHYSSISSPESWQHQCWVEPCRLQKINTTLVSVLVRFFKPCLCIYFCPTGAWQKACCHLLQLETNCKLFKEWLCAEFLNDYWNFNQYLWFEKRGFSVK